MIKDVAETMEFRLSPVSSSEPAQATCPCNGGCTWVLNTIFEKQKSCLFSFDEDISPS